ncbi:MAG: hypothetical protein AB1649_34790, partial [Chloroflexota bacterium]
MVDYQGNWYAEWYPEKFVPPVENLLSTARYYRYGHHGKSVSPEYDLRERLSTAVIRTKNQLIRLAMQLGNEGEYSDVLERQIESLVNLNMGLPFSPEELSEILN